MGRRLAVRRNNSVEEDSMEANGFVDKSVHEMETQVVGMDDEEEALSSSSSNSPSIPLESKGRMTRSRRILMEMGDSSPARVSPLLMEGRRTRSGRRIDEDSAIHSRDDKSKSVKPNDRVNSSPSEKENSDARIGSGSETNPTNNTCPATNDTHKVDLMKPDAMENNSSEQEKLGPLADFMANLNVSPSSSSVKSEGRDKAAVTESIPEHESGKTVGDDPQKLKVAATNEEAPGKLRSSVADAEGIFLARSYRKTLKETEEFALNYISQEFHHPVITCFRELTTSDIRLIIGSSKLKKTCNSLEQSIVYLGLIDLLATINNNPVYGETESSKLTKNLSSIIQKILLEFKNIMGTWALSCNEHLSNRYSLIINYLRALVPMFRKAGFDTELDSILDCIEREVSRHKQNQEKIKSMSTTTSTSKGTENPPENKPPSTDSQDGENRSALNEIILNVDLNVKLDDSDDDDEEVSVLKEEKSLTIFGKPLKGSPRSTDGNKKKIKKPRSTLDFRNSERFESPTNLTKHNNNEKVKTPKSHHLPKRKTLPQPKTLSDAFQLSDSPKISASSTVNHTSTTPSTKRRANEDANGNNDATKKRKLEDGSVTIDISKEKLSIKSFFKTVDSSSVTTPSPKTDKPTVNAFALMMNRSREIAQKKKIDKLNSLSVPTLKVNTVKS